MNELERIPTKLSDIKKENPFGTPNKYFDDFSARLQMKLETEEKVVPIQQNKIIRLLKPALGLAASFALIFMLVKMPLKTFLADTVASNTVKSELTENDYLSVVEGIDEDSFFALLDEPDKGIEFSDDDLLSYATANISEYELFIEPNK